MIIQDLKTAFSKVNPQTGQVRTIFSRLCNVTSVLVLEFFFCGIVLIGFLTYPISAISLYFYDRSNRLKRKKEKEDKKLSLTLEQKVEFVKKAWDEFYLKYKIGNEVEEYLKKYDSIGETRLAASLCISSFYSQCFIVLEEYLNDSIGIKERQDYHFINNESGTISGLLCRIGNETIELRGNNESL